MPVSFSIGVNECVCDLACLCQADNKVYLRWIQQLSFLGEDECQTFEVETISAFEAESLKTQQYDKNYCR